LTEEYWFFIVTVSQRGVKWSGDTSCYIANTDPYPLCNRCSVVSLYDKREEKNVRFNCGSY